MLLNSKEQLIIDHMNAVAKLFGGWQEEISPSLILERFYTLETWENRCHTAAEVMTDGEKRSIYFWYSDKNQNVREAEKLIEEWKTYILDQLKCWFVDSNKVEERIFVNTDPRGYAFKIRLTQEESVTSKIYYDWGKYGILCPDIELKSWEDDNDQMISRYMFN